MKKTFIYILLTAVAAFAVSCAREQLDLNRGIPSDNTAITLKPVVLGSVTRAATEPGDDDYNENTISSYYWFIFSDAAGTDLMLSGYQASSDPVTIPLDDVLGSSDDEVTAYAYVIANLPEKPSESQTGDAEWFEYVAASGSTPAKIKHVTRIGSDENTHSYDCTLAALKTIEFGKNTPVVNNAIVAGQSEFYTYTSATTGVPAPEKFVMRTSEGTTGATQSFTVAPKTLVEVTAGLKRVASKIILDLKVAQEVKQTSTNPTTGLEDYTKTWIADMDHIQIYMLWGSTHGNLAGSPVTYSTTNQDWFYFASPRYAMFRNPNGGLYNSSTNSVEGSVSNYSEISYPVSFSEWEVVFQVDESQGIDGWVWESTTAEEDQVEANIGNESYGHWVYILDDENNPKPALDVNGNIQRKLVTHTENQPYYSISSLPLYTMPIEWNVNDAHAPFIKIILPWQGCKRDNEGEGEIVSYDTKIVDGVQQHKTTEFYYKILVPKRTTLDANGCYHISLDLAVLGSEADEVPVELTGEYHVVAWNAPVDMGGDQSAGRYLKVARDTYDMYSNSLTIPVSASGPVVVTAYESATGDPSGTYPLGASNGSGTLNYSTSSFTGTNFMVTPNESAIIVKHTIEPFSTSFSAANGNAKDVAKITYKFRISLEGYPDYYKDVTVTQYPSIYVERQQSRGYPFVRGLTGNTINNLNGYTLGPVSNSAGSRSTYFTIVSISTLAGLTSTEAYSDWVIGDPRIRLADAYNGTYQNVPSYSVYATPSNDATQWMRTDLGESPNYFDKYLVGEKAASHFVAPKFMLATGYGYRSSLTNSNWKSNSERCATYQEDGYPAGRWRLPTEAEILFCATLASNGLIESPFVNGTNYWASSGGFTAYGGNGTFSYTYNQGTVSVRCVYDLWYWGDDPVVTPGTYTVMLPN